MAGSIMRVRCLQGTVLLSGLALLLTLGYAALLSVARLDPSDELGYFQLTELGVAL